MSGYRELQEAYERNHQATIRRRFLTRDALNGIRTALLARLGINDQASEVVLWNSPHGGELYPRLALLELKDVLRARGAIALRASSEAPAVSLPFDVQFEYCQEKVVVTVESAQPKTINGEMDLVDIANGIYELLLLRLSTY